MTQIVMWKKTGKKTNLRNNTLTLSKIYIILRECKYKRLLF